MYTCVYHLLCMCRSDFLAVNMQWTPKSHMYPSCSDYVCYEDLTVFRIASSSEHQPVTLGL